MQIRQGVGSKDIEFARKNFVMLTYPGGNGFWFEAASGKQIPGGSFPRVLDAFRKLPEEDRRPKHISIGEKERASIESVEQPKRAVPPGGFVSQLHLRRLGWGARGELSPRHTLVPK